MMPVQPPKPVKAGAQRGGVVLAVMALMLMPLLVYLAVDLFEGLGDADVVTRHPIGSVLRMSAPGGFAEHVVIETTEGLYPLRGQASISKGTALTLESRGSGRRYVCDVPRRLCLETTRDYFAAGPPGAKP